MNKFLAVTLCLIFIGSLIYIFSGPTHVKSLDIVINNNEVIPSKINKTSGQPFNGKAYDTFSGDRTFDCSEWIGNYKDGVPDGDFKIYRNCNELREIIVFKKGKVIKKDT